MEYKQIIEQKHVKSYLQKAVQNDRIAHSLIFEGEEGMGKKTIAAIYSQALLCENKDIVKPCNNCAGCARFASFNHPDFCIVKPHKKKSISTDDISKLISDACLIPAQGIRKVYIIQKAHMMTPSAQNKLLKILEEPPDYLSIILLCDNIANIIPTIISRAITVKMKKVSFNEVADALQEKGIEQDIAGEIAKLAGGNIGYALKIANDKKALNKYDEYKRVFFDIDNDMKIEAFSYLDKKRNEISDILNCWQNILSDCIKIKSYAGIDNYHDNEIKYADNKQLDDIMDKLALLLETESRLNANAQYLPTVDWLLSKL